MKSQQRCAELQSEIQLLQSQFPAVQPLAWDKQGAHTEATKSVKFMLLNVCGINSKLDCGEFIAKSRENDIIVFYFFVKPKTDVVDRERLEKIFDDLGFEITFGNSETRQEIIQH